MSLTKLNIWLDEAQVLQDVLDGPEWQETRKWLQGFLKVQAIYSDEEITEFRANAAQSSLEELISILEEIRENIRS